ncbi:hypothetical protein [Kitasatospora sp. LaBMicrA B282]|uniref:hypothetical protein n=1 Tax=Kitasatospora sp. LaBMicrA B282 TaxID=3420949 RepID=UPI003D0F70D0
MMVTGIPQFRSFRAGELPRLLGSAPELRGPGGRPARAGDQQPYDTVTAPLRLGLEALDILRLRRACGSVAQGVGMTVAFLVPGGTAASWHLPGTSCSSGAVALTATDPCWLVPPAGPDARTVATDPWVLRSALCEAACTLTASGLGPL